MGRPRKEPGFPPEGPRVEATREARVRIKQLPPEAFIETREPCFHCGVRPDIGCRHQRKYG